MNSFKDHQSVCFLITVVIVDVLLDINNRSQLRRRCCEDSSVRCLQNKRFVHYLKYLPLPNYTIVIIV